MFNFRTMQHDSVEVLQCREMDKTLDEEQE